MKGRAVLFAVCMVGWALCRGTGSAQKLDVQARRDDSLRAGPEAVVAEKPSAGPARETNSTANRVSWITEELPKPDAEGWIHLFDGKLLCGCTLESSDVQGGRVRVEGGLLHLKSAILHFNVYCNDVEVRARVKTVSGQSLKLTVRNTTGRNLWQGCATFCEGGNRFSAGKNDGMGWKTLIETAARKRYDDFFDLEVTAVGDKLTLRADGEDIYNVGGSSVDYGGVRFAAAGGTTLFERIELRILDQGANPREEFVRAVLANFARWDSNGDGELQERELTRWIQEPSVKGDAAAAVAALKKVVMSDKMPPLTTGFFQSYEPLVGRCACEFRSARKRLQASAGLPVFAATSPTLSECRQRDLGDCYLVAVLGAAIAREPGAIRRMIRTNAHSGGYHIDFPDGTRVDVADMTEGERAWLGATAGCLWQRLLEKGWGLRKICRSHGKADPDLEPFDVVPGGSGENMLLSLTGHQTVDYYLGVKGHEATPLDTLRLALKRAGQAHRLAEAFVWEASGSYFYPNHAYAVLGYDADSDSVRLWNPVGNDFSPSGSPGPLVGYKTVGGQFTMPLSELPAVFAHVRIEADEPAVVAGPKVFP